MKKSKQTQGKNTGSNQKKAVAIFYVRHKRGEGGAEQSVAALLGRRWREGLRQLAGERVSERKARLRKRAPALHGGPLEFLLGPRRSL